MFNKLSLWFHKISKLWVMLVSLAIMIFFMIAVLPGQAVSAEQNAGGSISPDTSFFYGPKELLQAAKGYGETGRRAYIQARWTFDLVFPLVYITYLVAGISWFYQKVISPPGWISPTNLLPVAAGLFDYLENTGASLVMGFYPGQIPGLALATAIFSGTKWLLISGSILAYITLAAAALFQWIGRMIRN